MSDSQWNRAASGQLERSQSTSALPALTWIQTPGIARQFFFSQTLANQADNSLDIDEISNSVLQGSEEQSAHTPEHSAINLAGHSSHHSDEHSSEFDFDNQFDVENLPHRHTVQATGISDFSDIDDLYIVDMAGQIKMDTYTGELGIKQQKFIDDCQTQWTAYQQGRREGIN